MGPEVVVGRSSVVGRSLVGRSIDRDRRHTHWLPAPLTQNSDGPIALHEGKTWRFQRSLMPAAAAHTLIAQLPSVYE